MKRHDIKNMRRDREKWNRNNNRSTGEQWALTLISDQYDSVCLLLWCLLSCIQSRVVVLLKADGQGTAVRRQVETLLSVSWSMDVRDDNEVTVDRNLCASRLLIFRYVENNILNNLRENSEYFEKIKLYLGLMWRCYGSWTYTAALWVDWHVGSWRVRKGLSFLNNPWNYSELPWN